MNAPPSAVPFFARARLLIYSAILLAIACEGGRAEVPTVRGYLRRDVYSNVVGITVASLTNSSSFATGADAVELIAQFEAPSNYGEQYGQRLVGYVIPPTTGWYTFYLASDDQSALFLSTDAEPSNKVMVASVSTFMGPRVWPTNGSAVSAPVRLEGDRAYYVEALMKEATGGDSLAVTWRTAGQPPPARGDPPIAGEFLAPFPPVPRLPGATGGSIDRRFMPEIAAVSNVRGIALQPDGKMILVGSLNFHNDANWWNVVRLDPSGNIDDTFRPSFDEWADLYSVAVLPNGKVLVSGNFHEVDEQPRCGLVRLNADGSLDPTFRLGGTDEDVWAAIRSFLIQPDGRIIIGGLGEFANRSALMRLHPDGSVDESFDAGEIVIWEGDGYVVWNMALQSDGRVLVQGEISGVQGQGVGGFFRLNSNGSLDTTFHPAWQTNEEQYGSVTCFALQPDGRIVVARWAWLPDGSSPLARILSDGSIDPTFHPDVNGLIDCFALAVQLDGKIVVGGNYLGVGTVPPVRLLPDGSRDYSFSPGSGAVGSIWRILPESPETMLIGGAITSYDGQPVPGLVRLLSGDMAPVILVQPEGRVARAGETVTLSVGATGWPTPAYQWLKGETPLGGETNAVLVLSNLTAGCGGEYRVAISNLAGVAASVPVQVQILPPIEASATDAQEKPAVASDGTNYLAVWMDRRHRNTTDYDIYGSRISASGEVIDTNGIPICVSPSWQGDPAVAFDGTNYLVVWCHRAGTNWNICAARVSTAGTVLDGGGIVICAAPGLRSRPRVAFNNGDYLVTWDDWRNNGAAPDIYGARLDQKGTVLDAGGFGIAQGAMAQQNSAVTGLTNGFLVAWETPADLRAAAVSFSRATSAPWIIATGHYGAPVSMAVSSTRSGPGWLVWRESFAIDGSNATAIYSVRLKGNGQPAMESLQARNAGSAQNISAATSALGFWAVWDTAADEIGSDIRGAWVPSYSDSGLARPLVISQFPLLQDQPAMACAASGCLVVWRDGRNAPASGDPTGASYDIYGTLLSMDSTVVQSNGFLISTMPGPDSLPSSAARNLPTFYRAGVPVPVALSAIPATNVSAYAVEDGPPLGWAISNVTGGGVFDAANGKVKFGPFYDSVPRTLGYLAVPPTNAVGDQRFSGTASFDGVDALVLGADVIAAPMHHPADQSPTDSRLSIGEVTSYGAAWRKGLSWPVAPNPIPIDYVSRAASLWRAGECYDIDFLETSIARAWVPCSTGVAYGQFLSVGTAAASSAAQSKLPGTFLAGEPIPVAVSVSPSPVIGAYAVEDEVPTGWVATAITDGGAFDATERKVKWGPFSDAFPRSLCYVATPAATASGSAEFHGKASFDGLSVPITGDRMMYSSARLTARCSSSGFILTCSTNATGRYVLEVSTNLVEWNSVREVPAGGAIEMALPQDSGAPQQFFRARRLD